jgi:hypothetical protein
MLFSVIFICIQGFLRRFAWLLRQFCVFAAGRKPVWKNFIVRLYISWCDVWNSWNKKVSVWFRKILVFKGNQKICVSLIGHWWSGWMHLLVSMDFIFDFPPFLYSSAFFFSSYEMDIEFFAPVSFDFLSFPCLFFAPFSLRFRNPFHFVCVSSFNGDFFFFSHTPSPPH